MENIATMINSGTINRNCLNVIFFFIVTLTILEIQILPAVLEIRDTGKGVHLLRCTPPNLISTHPAQLFP